MIYQGHTECTSSIRMARTGSILYGFTCIYEWDPTFVSENSYSNFLRKKVFAKVTF